MYVETGFPNTSGQYLPTFWDRNYDPNIIIPTVITYPAVFFDYHEHIEYMQQVTMHIPFDTAMQLITNTVMNNVEDEEEFKVERDHETDINIESPTTVILRQERLLDV